MIHVTSRIAGLGSARSTIAALPARARQGASRGLHDLAEAAAEAARQTLATQGVRSAPGSVPDDPSGTIAAAIMVEADEARPGALVTVALPFAEDLEFGTRRMAARPFLRPAAAQAARGATGRLAPHLSVALKQDNP